MTDSYQAIYDAVRSRISNGDIGRAVDEAIRNIGLDHSVHMVKETIQSVAWQYERPSVLFRPDVGLDGDKFCALYGSNIMDGCAGFGDTVAEAMVDFDKNWNKRKAPTPEGKS